MNVLYHHRTQGGRVEAVHIYGIVDGLRAMGHDVTLVGPPLGSAASTVGAGLPPGQRRPRVPTQWVDRRPPTFSRALHWAARRLPQAAFEGLELAYNAVAYPRLLKAARATRADVIYERAAAYAFAGTVVSRQLGIPLVVEINDVAGQAGVRRQRFGWLVRRLESFVLRRAAAAIPVTSYLRDELLARGMEEKRIAIIGNGFDSARFRPDVDGSEVRRRFGIGPDDCVVGFCGAMSFWYRLVDVVEEFARAFADAPRLRLLLIGDGPEREAIAARVAALNQGERILIGPRVPHDEVPAHLAAFDIALIPHCNQHGSPVKLFEYMGMAKPVVAVRTPGVTDIVTHEREALLADAGDLPGVMAHVARLAQDRELAAEMGRRGRELALARHTWQRNAERTFAVLESARREARGGGETVECEALGARR